MSRVVRIVAVVAVFAFVAIQLVPYGHDHTNPKVTKDAPWPTEQAAAIARASCYDCHSNETKWPWYSHVAPFSWVVQHNVDTARTVINFSDWDHMGDLKGQAASNVLSGEMPPRSYRMMHPLSQLTHDEKVRLARGLQATFGLPWRE